MRELLRLAVLAACFAGPTLLWLYQIRSAAPGARRRLLFRSLLAPLVVWAPLVAIQGWCITGSGWSSWRAGTAHGLAVVGLWFAALVTSPLGLLPGVRRRIRTFQQRHALWVASSLMLMATSWPSVLLAHALRSTALRCRLRSSYRSPTSLSADT